MTSSASAARLAQLLRQALDSVDVEALVRQTLEPAPVKTKKRAVPGRVSLKQIKAKLREREGKFYNLETHRIHGNTAAMRKKYPHLVFYEQEPWVCGSPQTLHSYADELSLDLPGDPDLVERSQDLIRSLMAPTATSS